MPIKFRCPGGHTLRARDDKAGKRVRCPKCGQVSQVPALVARIEKIQPKGKPAPKAKKEPVPKAKKDSSAPPVQTVVAPPVQPPPPPPPKEATPPPPPKKKERQPAAKRLPATPPPLSRRRHKAREKQPGEDVAGEKQKTRARRTPPPLSKRELEQPSPPKGPQPEDKTSTRKARTQAEDSRRSVDAKRKETKKQIEESREERRRTVRAKEKTDRNLAKREAARPAEESPELPRDKASDLPAEKPEPTPDEPRKEPWEEIPVERPSVAGEMPKKRGYRSDKDRISTVFWIAATLLAATIVGAYPAFKYVSLTDAPRWAQFLLFISALQTLYVIWMVTIPDWSTVWVAMLVFAVVAAIYGFALAVAVMTPNDTPLILGMQSVRRGAAYWCGAMLLVSLMAAFVCGRASHRWQKAYSLAGR